MSTVDLNSYDAFFDWCARQGLHTDRNIADAFGRTPQTVRNWKKARASGAAPPLRLELACLGYEASRRRTGELIPPFPEMSLGWFEMWCRSHGLATLEAAGDAFGLTRQAIHNWHKRGHLPRWLPLACLGYEEALGGGGRKETA